jgi:hypothetical protein
MVSCLARRRCTVVAVALISMVLVVSVNSATAQTPSPNPSQPATPKPIFVVRATTPIENEGKPTLDLVDLERYFVDQLIHRQVENVVPASTAKLPNPLPPNMYVIELSVDTMHPAERSVPIDSGHDYGALHVFDVDLSLTVRNLQTGNVVGTSGERYVYSFTPGLFIDIDARRLTEKRAAIFQAADNLAGRFVGELEAGRYGKELHFSTASTPPEPEPFLTQVTMATGIPAGLWAPLAVLLSVIVIAFTSSGPAPLPASSGPARVPAWSVPAPLPAPPPPAPDPHATWDKEFREALALFLKTDNFSDIACRTAAAMTRGEMLAISARITDKEAERLASAKARAAHYENLAAYASVESGLDPAAIVEILQKADQWEYRVLQEAKKIATEVSR